MSFFRTLTHEPLVMLVPPCGDSLRFASCVSCQKVDGARVVIGSLFQAPVVTLCLVTSRPRQGRHLLQVKAAVAISAQSVSCQQSTLCVPMQNHLPCPRLGHTGLLRGPAHHSRHKSGSHLCSASGRLEISGPAVPTGGLLHVDQHDCRPLPELRSVPILRPRRPSLVYSQLPLLSLEIRTMLRAILGGQYNVDRT
jgi:hypothetical protein